MVTPLLSTLSIYFTLNSATVLVPCLELLQLISSLINSYAPAGYHIISVPNITQKDSNKKDT